MPSVKAVIFDWAGTAVDFGSMAPVAAFADAFERAGAPVSVEEIRRPMGLEKRRHIAEMLAADALASRWRAVHGASPGDDDVTALYRAFNETLIALLPAYAEPVPGMLDTLKRLRDEGILIGSNSGYSARMMAVLAAAARELGFVPDCIVSADDVAASRPAPDLSLRCLELLGLDRDANAVKVDDTLAGIEEGRNAGLWTVAVAVSGNEVGLPLPEWLALREDERAALRARAYERIADWKADFTIESVADLPAVIERIAAA